MNADLAIVLTACAVAVAGSLLGVYLVLRRQSMMSDAISHAVLPGIVGAYALSGGTAAAPALLGAAAMGLLTVLSVQWLTKTGRVKSDAAIGAVFPLLFSVGVIWVSMSFRNVHLDLDAVLYGEIAYVPLRTVTVGGQPWPEALLLMGGLAALNALFVGLFYKELEASTFDPALAAALGFVPGALHYALMVLLSFTTVGAFGSVGAILIVAFIVVPAASAFLLTRRLPHLLGLALLIGVGACLLGYPLALLLDASIAGVIASVLGAVFLGALLLSPAQGVVPAQRRRARQRRDFGARLLLTALHGAAEPTPPELATRLGWDVTRTAAALAHAERRGWLTHSGGRVRLTADGQAAQQSGAAPGSARPQGAR